MEIFQTKEFWYFVISVLAGFVIYYMSKSSKDERKHLLITFKANQLILYKNKHYGNNPSN